jgi:glycosyltransferase involved in cell wall biosynthesis
LAKRLVVHVSHGNLRIPPQKGGGSEKHIVNLSQQLSENFKVVILDRCYGPEDRDQHVGDVLIHRLRAMAIPTKLVIVTGTIGRIISSVVQWLNGVLFSLSAISFIKLTKPSVVHFHRLPQALVFVHLCRNMRTRFVFTTHGLWSDNHSTWTRRLSKCLEIHVMKRTRLVLVADEYEKSMLVRMGLHKSTVVATGIPLNIRLVNPSMTPREVRETFGIDGFDFLLAVGRVLPIKGLSILIKAIRITIDRGFTSPALLIVGPFAGFSGADNDFSEYNKLRKLVLSLGLQKRIFFAGEVDESTLSSVYHAADVLVVSSLSESGPYTVLEAMCAAKPVIATRVGIVPHFVIDSYNGYATNPGDVNGLADCIVRFLSHRADWPAMGDRSLALLKEEEKRQKKMVCDIYTMLIGEERRKD